MKAVRLLVLFSALVVSTAIFSLPAGCKTTNPYKVCKNPGTGTSCAPGCEVATPQEVANAPDCPMVETGGDPVGWCNNGRKTPVSVPVTVHDGPAGPNNPQLPPPLPPTTPTPPGTCSKPEGAPCDNPTGCNTCARGFNCRPVYGVAGPKFCLREIITNPCVNFPWLCGGFGRGRK